MAEDVHTSGQQAEPAGESIHLPGPSYLPVVLAAGLTLVVTGVVISVIMVAIGLVVTVISLVRWIREARSEIAELPLEH